MLALLLRVQMLQFASMGYGPPVLGCAASDPRGMGGVELE